MKRQTIVWITLFVILLLDQATKFWVKLNMMEHDSIHVLGSWFQIYFIENEGMAFGLKWGGVIGKLILTTFRLIFAGFIFYYIQSLIKKQMSKGLIFLSTLVLAGALGNIIDCVFYGKIFSHSQQQIAAFLPADGGYGSWLQGKVVDMIFFPMLDFGIPESIPIIGGQTFTFFNYIFNIADASISIGIISIFVFQSWLFPNNELKNTTNTI